MRGRELREALHEGRRVYGTAVEGYGQPTWPRSFAQLGLDYVFLDNEHTPLNRETMAWAAQAYVANGIAPLLRIPEPTPAYAAMGLDLGAHGIIAPYVETVDQVKALVGAIKYRPLKGAALQAVLNENRFPSAETATFLADINPDAVVVIMIESPAGIDNLADMLAVPGVDAALIGPGDMSIALGIPQQFDHPVFDDAAKRVVQICQEHRVGVGIHFVGGGVERELRWVEWGCNFVLHRTDTHFIAMGISDELGQLRESLDGVIRGDAGEIKTPGHGT